MLRLPSLFHLADPVWHLIALLTWLVDFAERLVRTCVLWEGSLAVRNAHNSKGTPQDKDQGVKVKLESMEVDRDDLFDGELCMMPDCLFSSGYCTDVVYSQHRLQTLSQTTLLRH